MVGYIPLCDLKEQGLYKLHARNIKLGVWNGEEFLGIRTKWGERFIDGEEHWDAPAFATARPLELLGYYSGSLHPNSRGALLDWLEEQEGIYL